jgi:hypothetical protein
MNKVPHHLTKREQGVFDQFAWIREADLHLASSKILRAAWKSRRVRASKKNNDRIMARLVQEMEAAAKSSVLLISYAIELYLKAGLVPIYRLLERVI